MSKEAEHSRYFVIGLLATAAENTFVSPIKRVNNLVQVQGELIRQGRIREPYKEYIDCAKQSYSAGGISSFWRGNITGSLVSIPMKIAELVATKSFNKPSNGNLFKINDICFGGIVSSVYLTVFYPLEYAAFRLLSDVKNDGQYQFTGILDVFRKTRNTDGIMGLFRGLKISIFGIFAYRCLYFAFRSMLKSMLKDKKPKFLITIISVVLAGVIIYPLDTIRKRLMLTSGEDNKYNGTIDCLKQVVQNEGFFSLYNGIVLRMLEEVAGKVFFIFIAHKLRSMTASSF